MKKYYVAFYCNIQHYVLDPETGDLTPDIDKAFRWTYEEGAVNDISKIPNIGGTIFTIFPIWIKL